MRRQVVAAEGTDRRGGDGPVAVRYGERRKPAEGRVERLAWCGAGAAHGGRAKWRRNRKIQVRDAMASAAK